MVSCFLLHLLLILLFKYVLSSLLVVCRCGRGRGCGRGVVGGRAVCLVCVCFVCGVCVAARWQDVENPVCGFKKRLRVYIQNVPVYGGTTRTCVSTCTRGAGTHGYVLNVHTEAFLNPHTGGRRQFC